MTARYFSLGPLPGTTLTRWAVLHGDQTVWSVQVSRPDGIEVERPAVLRWRRQSSESNVKTKVDYQQFHMSNGEQPRKPVWSRAGRRAAAEVAI